MDTNNQAQSLSRIAEIIAKKSTGVILLPANPTVDTVAAAASLYLALLKQGKTVSLACSTTVSSELVGADKIQNSLSVNGDNLVISFPYSDGAIDKVDYNIQANNFNLIITPRPGQVKLNPDQVKYSYSGGNFDFIIVIDAPNLNSVGEIYNNNQKQFQGKDIINIDRHLTNGHYGTVNFVNKTISSVSELVFQIIQGLKIEIDKDIATNLYAGIAASTNNFTSYSVTASTFEAIANLLRQGAVKKTFKKPAAPAPFTASGSFQPSKSKEVHTSKPIEAIEKEPLLDEKKTTPQDWLKPKIFRGGGLI